jgi:asparagine synthase (glutamine-hydrolysing)
MFDEPFADSSAIPTFLVSQAARSGVTVALSGDGGDELFLGYPRYDYFARASWALHLPGPVRSAAAVVARRAPTRRLRRVADVLAVSDGDDYSRFVTWCDQQFTTAATGAASPVAPLYEAMLAQLGNRPAASQPALLDLVTYLPDDILTKVDRTSMAVGLEVRAPLLDHRVVAFALGLAPHFKHRNGVTKWLLRRLLYKRVPRALVDRPKMGFGVPLRDWFMGPLQPLMDDACASDAFEALGLAPGPFRTMWRQFRDGRPIRPDLVWQAFMLASWSRTYLPGRP